MLSELQISLQHAFKHADMVSSSCPIYKNEENLIIKWMTGWQIDLGSVLFNKTHKPSGMLFLDQQPIHHDRRLSQDTSSSFRMSF